MKIKKISLNNKHYYKNLRLKKTINGLGIFAKKNFKKDECILEFIGEIITKYEFDKIKNKKLKKLMDDYSLQIGKNIFLIGTGNNKKEYGDFINHSCDPNSYVYINGNQILLLALRNIKRGEEITYDYSTTMYRDSWSIKCNCQSKNCRGYIKEFKYLPKDIKIKYYKLGILPDYIIKIFFKKDSKNF
ncbi:MAG: SET domain-containing protein-lysine N-methyltransferase [Patescibacteria group bacterium]|nr:SET domain-containing protein-lysine N-methyltransferase [Patescibacteria group bacterium]